MRLTLVLLSLALCYGQETNPFQADPNAAEIGRVMFRIYCSPCHGIHAQGGRGPDLTRGTFAAGDSDADLYRVIARGVEGTEMSDYAGRFDEDMIWRFVAFIRSVARVTPTRIEGDAEHGRTIFSGKGGCSGCHAVSGTGGDVGPSLTRVGRERSI